MCVRVSSHDDEVKGQLGWNKWRPMVQRPSCTALLGVLQKRDADKTDLQIVQSTRQCDLTWWDPFSPSISLPRSLSRGSPFLGFCDVEDRMEKQREQFAKCVCRTQSSPCAIWVSSPREIAWNVYVLCSIEISLRNTQTNQVSSSLSVHKHRLLKYFYRQLSVQLKHSYRAVTRSDSG